MLKEWVQKYLEKGLTPIPLAPQGKNAIILNWPNRSREELVEFFEKFHNCNIGVRLDGLTVLDVERPELWDLFFNDSPEAVANHTLVVKTGGGGFHVYFKNETKPTKAEGFAELRSGSGQYVVAPPSIHPETGRPYELVTPIESVEIRELTFEIKKKFIEMIETLQRHGHFIKKWLRHGDLSIGIYSPYGSQGILEKLVLRKKNVNS